MKAYTPEELAEIIRERGLWLADEGCGCTVVIRLWRRQGRKTEDMRVVLPLSVPWGDPAVAVSVKEHAAQSYPTWEVIGWAPQREMMPHAAN